MFRLISTRITSRITPRSRFLVPRCRPAFRANINYQQCRLLGTEFTDPDFPPAPCILPANTKARWVRACELGDGYSHPKNLFQGRNAVHSKVFYRAEPVGVPEPDDLDQGDLGDCWLLATLSSLADFNNGAEIKKLFVEDHEDEDSTQHKYGVKLFDPRPQVNDYVQIEIDGWIPCFENENENKPLFTRPGEGAYWPVLLEKACAKLFRHYAGLDGGLPAIASQILTGYKGRSFRQYSSGWWECNTTYLDGKSDPRTAFQMTRKTECFDDEVFWNNLKQASEAKPGALMMAGIMLIEEFEVQALKVGIWNNHAYTILEVHEIDGQEQTRYLKLRNPWGQQKMRRDPGGSKIVADAIVESTLIAKDLGFTKKEDASDGGIVWVSLHDFKRVFSVLYLDLLDKKMNSK